MKSRIQSGQEPLPLRTCDLLAVGGGRTAAHQLRRVSFCAIGFATIQGPLSVVPDSDVMHFERPASELGGTTSREWQGRQDSNRDLPIKCRLLRRENGTFCQHRPGRWRAAGAKRQASHGPIVQRPGFSLMHPNC
jgi:hypothetical protein